MTWRRMIQLVLAVLLVVWCMGDIARAEVVRMRDGRSFEGQILTESPERIIIKTVIAGFPTRLTLSPDDIDQIDRRPLPKDFFSAKKDTPETSPSPEPQTTATPDDKRPAPPEVAEDDEPKLTPPAVPDPLANTVGENAYLEIPLHGTYGEEITAEGVKHVLEYAAEHGIHHIVFRLDSGGGNLFTTRQIQDAMKDYGDRMQYHTIIDRAISASIWTVFSSDTVHIVEGGTVGGAVAYKMPSFGHAEVDAKMNSIIAADLTAIAEKKHHPSVLVEAMIRMEATAAAWLGADGQVHVAKEAPRGVRSGDVLFEDGKKTVLTLTATQAIGCGLAERFDGPSPNLGSALGLSGWKKYNDYGESTMTWAAQAYKDRAEKRTAKINQLVESVVAQAGSINGNAKEAINYTPDPRGYAHYNTGRFTRESRAQWQRDTDRAIGAWERVQDGIDEMRAHFEDAKKLGILDFITAVDQQWKDYQERAGREIQDLRRGRSRTGI